MQRSPWLPKLVVAPSFALSLFFIYGLILWNGYLSVSASRILPNYEFVGFQQYANLLGNERFHVALTNMAIFGGLFIGGAMALGLLLAVAYGTVWAGLRRLVLRNLVQMWLLLRSARRSAVVR